MYMYASALSTASFEAQAACASNAHTIAINRVFIVQTPMSKGQTPFVLTNRIHL